MSENVDFEVSYWKERHRHAQIDLERLTAERDALRELLKEAYERLPKHMQDRIDAAIKASPTDSA